MATIEEIERREADIWAAEATALHNLAAHLREAVIELPAESQLARAFARRARTLEGAARHRDLALRGGGELQMLGTDARQGAPEHPAQAARAALLAAAEIEDDDCWAYVYRRIVSMLPDRGTL